MSLLDIDKLISYNHNSLKDNDSRVVNMRMTVDVVGRSVNNNINLNNIGTENQYQTIT